MKPPSDAPLAFPRHLLAARTLPLSGIEKILARAERHAEAARKNPKARDRPLAGRTVINLFFETSTRTQVSFDLAAKRLGADVVAMHSEASSIKKGESLIDTAMTLNAMRPDILVIRHNQPGAVQLLARKVDCAVVNAGDGAHEHPTQALLDALTIRRRKGNIKGLKIAICGDILHSRVARSNIWLLKTMGAQLRLIAPSTLTPPNAREAFGVEVFHDIDEGLRDCSIVMMLRLQQERMQGSFAASERDYFTRMGLTYERLERARPGALVMHPGPMNRMVEIDGALADDLDRSLIREQVETGVAVRMAVLELLEAAR